MLYTIVRKERLNKYRNKICQLNYLKQKKLEILNAFGLKAYDYSKIKVTIGNGKKLTDQEKAVLSVEKFDKKIRELEAEIKPETDELKKEINRVDSTSTNWRHAEALRRFYLYGENKIEAANMIYGDDTKQGVKNLNEILKTAIELLGEVSGLVDVQKVAIEDWQDEVKDEH